MPKDLGFLTTNARMFLFRNVFEHGVVFERSILHFSKEVEAKSFHGIFRLFFLSPLKTL